MSLTGKSLRTDKQTVKQTDEQTQLPKRQKLYTPYKLCTGRINVRMITQVVAKIYLTEKSLQTDKQTDKQTQLQKSQKTIYPLYTS